jgi:raffinose/stachyose/melibiose transport system permease protein
MVTESRPSATRTAGRRGDAGPGRAAPKQGRTGGVRNTMRRTYSPLFYVPAGIVYFVIFVVPTVMSFWFALTRWTLFEARFIGLDNFRQFFAEQSLRSSLINTLIYGIATSGLKVVLGLLLGVLLTSAIRSSGLLRSVVFFPVLVSTVAVGLTWQVLLAPETGLVNSVLGFFGVTGPDWLGNPSTALLSVALVDVWKGVGLATVIYIAGILAIPHDYYEAVDVDGGGAWAKFRNITLPLSTPATFTVILLSLIGGLRSFDLIWTMTKGGPGFSSDVIASVIYKQYQAGFFGLSTAGNVVLFVVVTLIVFPLFRYFNSREVDQ